MENCNSKEKCCCSCHSQKKEGECQSEKGHEEFSKFLFEIADCAWTEVLKEKIKEHILATQGDRMNELAKMVSEANSQRWKSKMEKKKSCNEFKEKLCNFFRHSN